MTSQLAALVLGTFVSEDLTTVGAGLLVSGGHLPALHATLACVLGIYLGDLGLWGVGRLLGPRVLAWRHIAGHLPPSKTASFAEWFARHAGRAIVGSRFTPGTRLPLYLAAGACRTSFAAFAWWSLIAIAAWTPALIAVSGLAGEHIAIQLARVLAAGRWIAVATGILVFVGWRVTIRLTSRRGRQQLVARIVRIWRWEFWPMWIFYAPVALWTLLLAIRYRGYHTLSAANPGMPDGGVVGESKFEILSRLPAAWTIPSVLLPPAATSVRVHGLRASMAERAWRFPIVLKPDIGQRGSGVRLVRSLREAAEYLERLREPVLAQPYHEGPFEAGVFYYRMPESPRGQILCITDKRFPMVTGDGRSTLEELVWAHPRYRMQAATFLARLGARQHDVPGLGEPVSLGIAGNHAQGAMFTDGRALITHALESRVDSIARSYDGFFIGRFDVRYGDREAFMAGSDLAIVELNGATAECTNIYDPASSLLSAYRQLFLQWRLVFAIGAANRRAGGPVTPPRRLLALVRSHLQSSTPFPVAD